MDTDQKQMPPGAEGTSPFLRRVQIRNYKSIASCTLSLRRFSVIVGRNAAGKSNFLDALRFVTDALDVTPDHAIKTRGGLDAVRRISTGHPRNFAVTLDVTIPPERNHSWFGEGGKATYGFEIAARGRGAFVVSKEVARTSNRRGGVASFRRKDDSVVFEGGISAATPPIDSKRLFLQAAAAYPPFGPLFEALRSMGFYNLNPSEMKELQSPDAGELLHADGSNIASVMARLEAEKQTGRLHEFLHAVVPGLEAVERATLGPKETLQFRQGVKGSKHPWKFYAQSMSDGTLRTVGLLVAVMQMTPGQTPVRLIGIEEPETALHPAAAGALIDALREASLRTQILLTCHSPDLLDHVDPDREQLLAAHASEGTTGIAPIEAVSLDAIRDHLYSPGELLRMDQLAPDPIDLQRQLQGQLELFEEASQ